MKLNHLINITTLIIIGCLVGFYFRIQLPYFWVPYVFYVWVSVYGAATVSQFWLLANAVFTSTQSKRLSPLLGLGAIIGGWAGGEPTGLILPYFKTIGLRLEDLLFCGMVLPVVSILLTNIIWRGQSAVAEEQSHRSVRAEVLRIILTGYADRENAIKAINDVGLYQYVEKPRSNDDLLIILRNGMEKQHLREKLRQMIEEINKAHGDLEGLHRETVKTFV